MLLESKKDLKKRTKGSSPDRADALALLVEVMVANYGLSSSVGEWGENDEDWEKFVLDNSLEPDYQD